MTIHQSTMARRRTPMLRDMPPLRASRYEKPAANDVDSDESDGYIPTNMFHEYVGVMSYLTLHNVSNWCNYMSTTLTGCVKSCVRNMDEYSEWAIENRLIY